MKFLENHSVANASKKIEEILNQRKNSGPVLEYGVYNGAVSVNEFAKCVLVDLAGATTTYYVVPYLKADGT